MLDDIRVGTQVLPPSEVAKTSIEEATNLFDSKFRRHNQDSDTMEIDVESDSGLSNGQTKMNLILYRRMRMTSHRCPQRYFSKRAS